MTIKDRIGQDLAKKAINSDELIKSAQGAAFTLLEQAMMKIKTGEMKIEDPNDFVRIWAIIEKTTDYTEVMENRDKNATGMLPEISTKEAKALGVNQEITESGDVETEDVTKEDFESTDADDIFNNLITAMNNDNVEKMDKD